MTVTTEIKLRKCINIVIASLFCVLAFRGVFTLALYFHIPIPVSSLIAGVYCYIAMKMAFDFARKNPDALYSWPFYIPCLFSWMIYLFFACLWPIAILVFMRDLMVKLELWKKLKNILKQDIGDVIHGKTKDAKEIRFLVIALVVLLVAFIVFHYLGWLNKPLF